MNARTTARRGADSALIFEHLENRLLLSGCTQPFFWCDGPLGPATGQLTAEIVEGLSVSKFDGFANFSHQLNQLWGDYRASPTPTNGALASMAGSVQVQGDYVLVDTVASGRASQLWQDLARLGMRSASQIGSIISGQFPIAALGDLAQLDSLQFAAAALRPWTQVGSVTSQGDLSLNGPAARSLFGGIDGSGVTVGVLSDSFDTGSGSYQSDISSGDLPAGIQVLEDYPGGTDEGRAMMQLIYDVAPGVDMAFHTAFNGIADFANGITELAAISDIVVDDVIYFAEPMFQDGPIAQAIDAAVAGGTAYFSAAGNAGQQGYESVYRDSLVDLFVGSENRGRLHDFDPGGGVDYLQEIYVPFFSGFVLTFQWDEPFFSVSGGDGSTKDLDVYVTNYDGSLILAESITRNEGGDSVEVLQFTNLNFPNPFDPNDAKFNIMISSYAGGAPGLLKYIRYDTGPGVTLNQFDTQSSTLFGHANADGASAVGAAYYGDTPAYGQTPPLAEAFSSGGGTPILFDTSGNRLTTPVVRQKPDIVAPDGGDTTFFGQDTDGNGFPNFFGTSAAAPHAAAVAALLLEAHPGRTPAEIYNFMETTAIDMDVAGFDFNTGQGLVQADAALSSSGEAARLNVSITEASIDENGAAGTGTVTRRGSDTTGDLVVQLASSDTDQATVPASVTILDGQASATFAIAPVDDELSDGNQIVTITATAVGFYVGADSLTVIDDEPQFLTQWATIVIDFSSQWTGDPAGGWTAAQALGMPDTFEYGDLPTAWAASTQDGNGTEYLTLGYDIPVLATAGTIRQTWNNGFVTRVEVRDAATLQFHTVWSGTDTSNPGAPVNFDVTWDITTYYVDALRVTIDSNHVVGDWEEIDAIALRGWTDVPSTIDNLATAETSVDGTVIGDYTDTHLADNQYEAITEVLYAGNKRTRMNHEWDFNVSGGNTVSLIVEAYHDSAVESFQFEYSTDGGASWIPAMTITNVETTHTLALPESTSGLVIVRAVDTDRSRGETARDTLYVDQIVIRSTGSDNGLPQVAITASDASAAEQNTDPGRFTITRSNTSGDLTVYYAISGTAGNGVDYATIASSVVIADGNSSVDIVIDPVDDGDPEPTETVTLTLQPDAAYSVGASNSADVDILDNDGGGQSTAVADGEIPVSGNITQGTYADTWTSDNVREVIEEEISKGKPNARYSLLEHKWTFSVVSGSSITFYVEASNTNLDGDNFEFAYSTDDVTYTSLLTVNSGTETLYSAALPATLAGTVYIRATDTDRTAGNVSRDSLVVDHMYIETQGTPNGLRWTLVARPFEIDSFDRNALVERVHVKRLEADRQVVAWAVAQTRPAVGSHVAPSVEHSAEIVAIDVWKDWPSVRSQPLAGAIDPLSTPENRWPIWPMRHPTDLMDMDDGDTQWQDAAAAADALIIEWAEVADSRAVRTAI